MNLATKPSSAVSLESPLNVTLAAAIALKLQAKQAHWNIRGANFIMWHELLDNVATLADEISDNVAERNVQLGGMALGLVQNIEQASSKMTKDVAATRDIPTHVKAVLNACKALQKALQETINAADDADDNVTEDLAISSLGDLDKQIWFISAHEVA
jgi:starvation-inducible DNA-binding protein